MCCCWQPAAAEAHRPNRRRRRKKQRLNLPLKRAAAEEEANADAAEVAPDEEEALGSSLIGEIEGPTIITDEAAFPTEFNEAPMLAEKVAAGELPRAGRTTARCHRPVGHRAGT